MKKLGGKSFAVSAAYLVVAFVLCASIIFYTGNGGTEERRTFADITDTMEASGEIVIGEEEVPLGNKPKVTVKKTKKTSTKKKKLKKAAKKTKTVTKTKTSTKKSTKKSATAKVVTETTVETKTKTSTKENSKVETIKTTVYTTVKTTKTAISSSVGSASSSYFTITKFSDIKGHVDSRVYDAFNELGFKLVLDTNLGHTGVFSVSSHNIQLKTAYSCYLLHELGHFVSVLRDDACKTDEFKAIYKAEKDSYTGSNKAYVTKTASEYFAESFRDYTEDPSALKSSRPRTYAYVNSTVNAISDNDVKEFKKWYGYYWE